MIPRQPADHRDNGSILPMVLVMTVVLSAVILSLAAYVSAGLRYSTVVEDRADRLAAADGGLRYGIERLELQSYAGCFTALGNTGYEIPFPGDVNQSDVTVTCRKAGTGFGDVQGWAVIVTGEGVPVDEPLLLSAGGNGTQKLLGGPVYVARVQEEANFDLQAPVEIEDGDLWFSDTAAKCDNVEDEAPGVPTNLTFKPVLRGMLCLDQPWNVLYTAPTVSVPTTPPAEPPTIDESGCTVWRPGKYTAATVPALGSANYFTSGEYYFEDVDLVIDRTVVAGWADFDQFGDQQFVQNPKCDAAVYDDQNTIGSTPGATFYLGGTSTIRIAKGELEILRRRQGTSVVSIQALDTSGPGYIASSLGWDDEILSSKSGSPTQDMVIHGLAWAPRSQLTFGNVTNVANGQLLGGAAFARIDLQSSASASNFVIRVESGPIPVSVILDSQATKDGQSTTMRAIVQISDDGIESAVNSWRVCETPDCAAPPPAPPPPPPTTTLPPGPTPTTGPCNKTVSSWTDDFGDMDWTAKYWNLASFTSDAPPGDPFAGTPVVTRTLSKIDGYFGMSSPVPGVVNTNYYVARFTTTINVGTACSVKLRAGSDDGMRVRIDGATVINSWSSHAHSTATVTSPTLSVGSHTIEVEYFERTGDSSYEFEWQS